jgi:DNA replication protein DnaC
MKNFKMQMNYNFLLPEPLNFSIPNPDIPGIFKRITGKFQYLPEYEKIEDWLKNNEGKGLAMIGANGRGKTVFGRYIIPYLFAEFHRKIITTVDAHEMNVRLDELLKKRLVSIDDIGTEEQRIIFGERRWALPELMDKAEKNRNIIILTSNLDADAIQKKYGIRTRERIRATCKVVIFKGGSLRK